MRVPFAAIVVVSLTLAPIAGEANPITPGSLPPGTAADGQSGAPAADPWAGLSSLFDEGGDTILHASGFTTFVPPGNHDKLRGGPSGSGGGIVFTPTAGGWGGGSGPTGFGSFTLLSIVTQNPPPGPGPGPGFNFGLGSGSGSGSGSGPGPGPEFGLGFTQGLSFEPCCEEETPTVPEPATMLLVGTGLMIGLKRAARGRA